MPNNNHYKEQWMLRGLLLSAVLVLYSQRMPYVYTSTAYIVCQDINFVGSVQVTDIFQCVNFMNNLTITKEESYVGQKITHCVACSH